jgi:uncharacterized membrane-anchored protein
MTVMTGILSLILITSIFLFLRLCAELEHKYKLALYDIAEVFISDKDANADNIMLLGTLINLLETKQAFALAKVAILHVWEKRKTTNNKCELEVTKEEVLILFAVHRFLFGAIFSRPIIGIPLLIKLGSLFSSVQNETKVKQAIKYDVAGLNELGHAC